MDYKAWAAQHWFGYGRWDAPYWFVGMEPGGTDEHTSYQVAYQFGKDNGLLDCREHHLATNFSKWHDANAPTQPTWRRLIQLLLSYKQRPTSMQQVSEYQQIAWGSVRGETAVLELSALHAPNVAADVDRVTHRSERIATLASKLRENTPTFAVFYGRSYRSHYERVIGCSFESGVVRVGKTLCVLVPHPTAQSGPGTDPTYWLRLGKAMRSDVDGSTINATLDALNEPMEDAG